MSLFAKPTLPVLAMLLAAVVAAPVKKRCQPPKLEKIGAMIARLALCVLGGFAMFGGCHLFSAEPTMLWDPAVPLPHAIDMPVIAGTRFAVIKPYEFEQDGYRFLHGVGLAHGC